MQKTKESWNLTANKLTTTYTCAVYLYNKTGYVGGCKYVLGPDSDSLQPEPLG